MAVDKHTSTLNDMCELIVDCPHFTPEWTEEGFVVVRNQNIRNGRLDLSQPSFTHQQDFERRIKRAKPKAGDIIFTREAPMGEVCMIPRGLECCLGQRQVLLRPKSDISKRYLFFALRSAYVRHQILWNEGTGSTVSNVRIPVLEALKIPRLGKAEEYIGELLGALEDKIDLNRRMNETLEQTARTLFKDWFVDFGPTKAKMAGQAAYLEADLWDLFPERLDEVGVPEGWRIGELQELVRLNPTEKLVKNKPAPYLDMAALPTSGSIPERPILRDFTSGTRFRNGDTLFARITPCLENGKTAFVQTLPNDSVGWGSTEFIVLRAKSPVPAPYTYLLARSEAFREHAIQSMTGTSGRQRARNEALSPYPLAIPDSSVWKAFSNIVEPLFRHIKANGEESRTLSQTRDLLLPKLMSGALRVHDIEKNLLGVF